MYLFCMIFEGIDECMEIGHNQTRSKLEFLIRRRVEMTKPQIAVAGLIIALTIGIGIILSVI